jgi:hypothetical protein
VTLLLWLPTFIIKTELGAELVGMRDSFISQESGKRFLGCLVAQPSRLIGERAHNVSRPELVAKYGHDTKFAMHALRLGFEGIELLKHRRLTLPVAEPDLTTLRAVRAGEVDLTEALRLIDAAEAELRELVSSCTWTVDEDAIDAFLVRAHLAHWGPMTARKPS